MVAAPFVGDVRSNFAAKNVKVELEIGPFLIQSRQIDSEPLQIETAGEANSAESEAIFLPFRCTAQLRECLAQHGRSDGKFPGGEMTGFDLVSGDFCVAQKHDRRAVLDSQI